MAHRALQRRCAPEIDSRTSPGFTTTELLITMAMFAIVIAVSLPGFHAMLEGYRFKGAVNQVTSRLFATRQMAVRDKVAYVVSLDTEAARLSVFADDDRDGVFEPGEQSFGPYELGPNIQLVNVSWQDNRVTFFPNGTASSTGDVRVTDGDGRSETIRVSSTTGSTEILP